MTEVNQIPKPYFFENDISGIQINPDSSLYGLWEIERELKQEDQGEYPGLIITVRMVVNSDTCQIAAKCIYSEEVTNYTPIYNCSFKLIEDSLIISNANQLERFFVIHPTERNSGSCSYSANTLFSENNNLVKMTVDSEGKLNSEIEIDTNEVVPFYEESFTKIK